MPYKIIDLGALNGSFSHGMAINNRDQVVGWTGNPAAPNSANNPAPFIWAQGVMLNLALPAGPMSGQALDLNDFQQAVGWVYNSVANLAAIWTNGIFTKVAIPGDGQTVYGVNDCGMAVGEGGPPTTGNIHGYSDQNGTIKLPPIPPTPPHVLPDDRYTRAYGINNHGQVAGGSDTGQPIFNPKPYAPPVPGIHAVVWDNGLVTDLGTLNPGEGSEAYGINDNSQIVGVSGKNAVLWHGGAKTNLGPGIAFNVNNAGVVIGDTFLWHGGTRTLLASLLPAGSGWSNLEGRDINDQGRITGTGTYGGQQRAFLMWQ